MKFKVATLQVFRNLQPCNLPFSAGDYLSENVLCNLCKHRVLGTKRSITG